MASDMRVSNSMGVPIPQWLINQFSERSKQISIYDDRSTDNLIYLANKTSWVRLVSSVDVIDEADQKYFRENMGISISDPQDLARNFVLQGGTFIYQKGSATVNQNTGAIVGVTRSQKIARSGLNGAYNVAGPEEIKQYGYRPMPGLGAVKVVTQGKMGSIRSADIQIRVWDKLQLDIIDALYFKLGYSMFLEWGHTKYYNNKGELKSSEALMIDAFTGKETKESIYNRIYSNIRESDGNYDAMLGLVTNFNFTNNQEGGYDCTLKLQALGVLASGMKINNPRILPDLAQATVKKLYNTLEKIKSDAAKNNLPPVEQEPDPNKFTFQEFIDSVNISGQSKLKGFQSINIQPSNVTNIGQSDIWANTQAYGNVYLISNLKAIVPTSQTYAKQIQLDKYVSDLINRYKIQIVKEFNTFISDTAKETNQKDSENLVLIDPTATSASEIPKNKKYEELLVKIPYTGSNKIQKKFEIKVKINKFATYSPKTDDNFKIVNDTIQLDPNTLVDKLINALGTLSNFYNVNNIELSNVDINGIKQYIANTTIKFNLGFIQNTEVIVNDYKNLDVIVSGEKKIAGIEYINPVELTINDSALIANIKVDTRVVEPIDYGNQNINQIPNTEESEKITIDDIQTSESLKYQSAFETVIRTIQLYSLDNALQQGLEIDSLVKTTNLTDSANYTSFTKKLFSIGLFSKNLDNLITGSLNTDTELEKLCIEYDSLLNKGLDNTKMFNLRSKFGFNFNLMSNSATAKELYDKKLAVDFSKLMTTYTVPYEFNTGVIEGTQINHPVYISLGFVAMIINHICSIYDTKKSSENGEITPMVYLDFNTNSNICLSNKKHLTTNPYNVLIRFEGTNDDYRSILEPTVLEGNYIKSISGSEAVPLFKPDSEDYLSSSLPYFKFRDSGNQIDAYRGKTMNILLSVDYLLKTVQRYTKEDASGDIYAKAFIEQILFDINKCLGDFNMFRLAYSDHGNTLYIVDDQFTPNLEDNYVTPTNKSEIPFLGVKSIAKTLEIRTDISSRLSNLIAISANSSRETLSTLSKNGDSFGQYNLGYNDRYIADRQEFKTSGSLPTYTMIDSAKQFNEAIRSYYSKAKPADSGIDHVTNYYIQRMSKIKSEDKATRSSAIIPVSLNFSTDGISAVAMGQSFTVNEKMLPYTYNVSLRNLSGEVDKLNTVGFVIVGFDQTIENNQWTSNVRASMMYMKKVEDFKQGDLKDQKDYAPAKSFINADAGGSTYFSAASPEAKKAAEIYIGRSLSDTEWNELVSATFAEASANQKERGYVMGVILNRARTNFGKYGSTISEQLRARNQFQAVTGTSDNRSPSINFVNGPNKKASDSIYGAAVNILKNVPKNYIFFTAADIKAYGKGTNPEFRNILLKKGGEVIEKTIFSS